MILTDLNTEQNSYNDLNTFFALENINIAYIDIDFNRKEEVLGYFNPSESFRPGKPDLISKFLSLATFWLKFDVLYKKIKELIRTVEETILKIVLSNDHFIVCQDTQRS